MFHPTEVEFTPGIVSQHISDLYSEDELSRRALIILASLVAKDKGPEVLQAWYNHRLGKVWSKENTTTTTTAADNKANLAGLGGAAAANVKLWSYVHVPSYHEKFCELHDNDQRAKDALYADSLKRMRSRIWFPVDVEEDPSFVDELCAERQKQVRGHWVWDDNTAGPNHYGDSLKEAILGLRYLTRQLAV